MLVFWEMTKYLGNSCCVGESLLAGIKKVDAQGRISLPARWRSRKLHDSREAIVIEKGEVLLVKPRGKPVADEVAEMKKNAKVIVKRINSGERVATSLTHLSEVANILEASMPIHESHTVMRDLIHSPTIAILEPSRENYVDAVEVAEEA